MREFILIFLYGAVSLAAFFLAVFWSRFSFRRWQKMVGNGIWHDRYFLLATAIAVNSTGLVILFGSRTVGSIIYGSSAALTGWETLGVMFGLIVTLCSKTMLVWLADLEEDPPVWTWLRWMTIITTGWAVVAILLVGISF